MRHQSYNRLFRLHSACTLGLLLLSSSFAAQVAHGRPVVTTRLIVPFRDTVFLASAPQPEWVSVSGTVHSVTRVVIPGEACIPGDPCKNLDAAIRVNLANARAVGQTTGQTYPVRGAENFRTTTDIPGTLVLSFHYALGRVGDRQPLTLSMALTARGTATATAVQPSLISWWRAEGDAADAAGNNPGTLVGNVSFVPGKTGQAFHFDGASLVEVPTSTTLEPQTLTTMLWIRALPQPATYLLSKGASACNADSSYAFYTGSDLNFYISDGLPGNFSPSPPPATDVFDGNWHHLAGTYDGGTVRLYVDGVEQGTGNPAAIATLNYALPDNRTFRIGGYTSSCISFLFSGDIDEVQLFSRALSADEIGAIYTGAP